MLESPVKRGVAEASQSTTTLQPTASSCYTSARGLSARWGCRLSQTHTQSSAGYVTTAGVFCLVFADNATAVILRDSQEVLTFDAVLRPVGWGVCPLRPPWCMPPKGRGECDEKARPPPREPLARKRRRRRRQTGGSFLSVTGAACGSRDRGVMERGVRPRDDTTAGDRTDQALRIKDQVNSNKDQCKTNESQPIK